MTPTPLPYRKVPVRRLKFSHVDMYLAKAHVAAEPTGAFFEVGHTSVQKSVHFGPTSDLSILATISPMAPPNTHFRGDPQMERLLHRSHT